MSAFNSVSDNVRSVSAGYSRGVELIEAERENSPPQRL
jgi:hypothetical protein